MSSIVAFFGDNSVRYDSDKACKFLEKYDPELMFPGEAIIMAFKGRGGYGRDYSFFTSFRVLLRDKNRIGKRTKYQSVPYKSIKAFSIETAGLLDADVKLTLFGSGGIGKVDFDFATGSVDILAINRFLAQRMFKDVIDSGDATIMPTTNNKKAAFFTKIGLSNNASQVNAEYVKEHYKDLLLEDEEVELAFKCGRDTDILTTKRVIGVDVKGLTGSKIEFLSIRWECIKAFSVRTPGGVFDLDFEIMLLTNMGYGMTRINRDIKKGTVDFYAVQKYFSDKLLGVSGESLPLSDTYESKPAAAIFTWFNDNAKTIDSVEMNDQYHSNPPLLQVTELVEMAFKGRRDFILFTNKRLVIIDFQGWSGKKVEYVSIPWKTVQSFGVRSAGSILDRDCEAFIWTEINDVIFPPKDKDDAPPPPIPRNTFFEFDFNRNAVDLLAIQRYLSERCINPDNKEPFPVQDFSGSASSSFENFMSWLGNDHQEIEPAVMNEELTKKFPILVADENVVMAFKAGRDSTVFTNKRILLVDVKGFRGKKIEWRSIPYTAVRGFSGKSAGRWDFDAELKLYCRIFWDHKRRLIGSKDTIDFKKGKADIIEIQNLLAHYIIGSDDGSCCNKNDDNENKSITSTFGFPSWFSDKAEAIDEKKVEVVLHSAPNILLPDEKVDYAYKVGRDMLVFTTKRVLTIDKRGFRGRKIEYMTYPLRYCTGYNGKSPGYISFFKPTRFTVCTDVPGETTVGQRIKGGAKELWKLQTLLGQRTLLQQENL